MLATLGLATLSRWDIGLTARNVDIGIAMFQVADVCGNRSDTGNPSVSVFDGYLKAGRESAGLNAVQAVQTLGNKGWRVFDGYLMGGGFQSWRTSMPPVVNDPDTERLHPIWFKKALGRVVRNLSNCPNRIPPKNGLDEAARTFFLFQLADCDTP